MEGIVLNSRGRDSGVLEYLGFVGHKSIQICFAFSRQGTRSGVARLDAFPHVWRGRNALPRGAASGVRRPCPVQRLGWPMRSGASGVARLDAPFIVLHSALSIIAPSVKVLRRTRRKPSTIRGAAPDVVIGQSAAARAVARPYHGTSPHIKSWPESRRGEWFLAFLSSARANPVNASDNSNRSRPENQHRFPMLTHI